MSLAGDEIDIIYCTYSSCETCALRRRHLRLKFETGRCLSKGVVEELDFVVDDVH